MYEIGISKGEHLDEIASDTKALFASIYPNRVIGNLSQFQKFIASLIHSNADFISVTHNKKLVGFYIAYIDNMNGLTEPIYNGHTLYIKPTYRKTRVFKMLLNHIFDKHKSLGLKLEVQAIKELEKMYLSKLNGIKITMKIERA